MNFKKLKAKLSKSVIKVKRSSLKKKEYVYKLNFTELEGVSNTYLRSLAGWNNARFRNSIHVDGKNIIMKKGASKGKYKCNLALRNEELGCYDELKITFKVV